MAKGMKLSGIFQRKFIENKVSVLSPAKPHTVDRTESLYDVLIALKRNNIGSVLVTADDMIEGIFTERDALLRVGLNEDQDPRDVQIEQYMTRQPQLVRSSASVARVMYMMSTGGFRHLPVVHRERFPVGVLSVKNLMEYVYRKLQSEQDALDCDVVADNELVRRFFCSSIEELQYSKPVSIAADTTIDKAVRYLQNERIGSVTITGKDNKIEGIFTERDFLMKVLLEPVRAQAAQASDFMTRDPVCVSPDISIQDAFEKMQSGGFRHLPVLGKGGELIGVLSIKDFFDRLAQAIVDELSASVS